MSSLRPGSSRLDRRYAIVSTKQESVLGALARSPTWRTTSPSSSTCAKTSRGCNYRMRLVACLSGGPCPDRRRAVRSVPNSDAPNCGRSPPLSTRCGLSGNLTAPPRSTPLPRSTQTCLRADRMLRPAAAIRRVCVSDPPMDQAAPGTSARRNDDRASFNSWLAPCRRGRAALGRPRWPCKRRTLPGAGRRPRRP